MTALVLSHVHYCLSVYGNGSAKNLATINKILNFAARVISGKKKFDHISSVRVSLNWPDPLTLVKSHTLHLLHKVRRAGQPESLAAQILTNAEREDRSRSTRQDHLLSLPRIRGTAAGKRQFMYRAAVAYNALPRDAWNLSARQFYNVVMEHLTNAT